MPQPERGETAPLLRPCKAGRQRAVPARLPKRSRGQRRQAPLRALLLEHCVTELGGTYAMEDTDSMAIVATEDGGFVPCASGRIKALSWKQVQQISDRFAALNPYDRDAISGSVLKIEDDNRDPETGNQRQIYCFAISAKRYALFILAPC